MLDIGSVGLTVLPWFVLRTLLPAGRMLLEMRKRSRLNKDLVHLLAFETLLLLLIALIVALTAYYGAHHGARVLPGANPHTVAARFSSGQARSGEFVIFYIGSGFGLLMDLGVLLCCIDRVRLGKEPTYSMPPRIGIIFMAMTICLFLLLGKGHFVEGHMAAVLLVDATISAAAYGFLQVHR